MINEYLMYFYVYKHDIFTYHLFPQNDSDDGENSMNGEYCAHGTPSERMRKRIQGCVYVCVVYVCEKGGISMEIAAWWKGMNERTNEQAKLWKYNE